MKSRTFYSAIALFAGLLVFLGAIGFWGLTSQNPRSLLTKGGQAVPEAAQFVPRQAPIMVSLLARPDRLWQLHQVLMPANKRFAARQEWQSLKQILTGATGWDYEADVRPWLDQEVTFAVTTTDLDRNDDNGIQSGYLTVLGCRDAMAAREALHLLWQNRAATGRSLVFESVSGVPIIYDQSPYGQGEGLGAGERNSSTAGLAALSTALVGDRYVLLANMPQVIRQAIATYQAPDVSLAQAPNYRDAIADLPDHRIGWLYANVPNLLNWLGIEPATAPSPLGTVGQKANFLFTSLRAFPAGIIGDSAIAAAPGVSFAPQTSSPELSLAALNYLPEETVFAASGHDLRTLLASLDEDFGGYDLAHQSLQALLKSLSFGDPDIPRQLFPTIQGDYAIGALPGTEPAWILMTQSEDQAFAEVDQFVQTKGISVSQVSLGDREITTWSRLKLNRPTPDAGIRFQTDIIGVHTNIRGYEALSTSVAGLEKVLQSAETLSLSKGPEFVALMQQFQKTEDTLAYINWPAIAPTLRQRSPLLKALTLAGQPLTKHIGPIVVGGFGHDASSRNGVVAIKLMENP